MGQVGPHTYPVLRLVEIFQEIANSDREQAPQTTLFPDNASRIDYALVVRVAAMWICYPAKIENPDFPNPAIMQRLLNKWFRVDAGLIHLEAKSIADLKRPLWTAIDDIARCLKKVNGVPRVRDGAVLQPSDPVV